MPNTYQSSYTGQHNDNYEDRIAILEAFKETFLNTVYPIGSIYMSMNTTNPSTLFGGTWERISGRFLLGCGGSGPGANNNTDFGSLASAQQTWFSDISPGNTGGEYFHTLTTAQTPAHTHTRGTMEITGVFAPAHSSGVCWYETTGATGAFSTYDSVSNCAKPTVSGTYTGNHRIRFTASNGWSGATSSVGGNESHNNMPPYLAVAIWKRTA